MATSVPEVLKFAALDFAAAFAYRRKPDVAAAMGPTTWKDMRKAALEKMTLFTEAKMKVPSATGQPANVGGGILSPEEAALMIPGSTGGGTASSSQDCGPCGCSGTCNCVSMPRWGGMGDFS